MAKLVFSMNQSLDGYVDHERFAPGEQLFRHFIDHVRGLSGSIYGRRLYELMRYWDQEQPGWGPAEREFATAWRAMPKWVVSRTLTDVGPNATLIAGDVAAAIRDLKTRLDGEIAIGGPHLAGSLVGMGLIDEYRIYLRPYVLMKGTPYFAAPPPPLRLAAHEVISDDAIRLTYVPDD